MGKNGAVEIVTQHKESFVVEHEAQLGDLITARLGEARAATLIERGAVWVDHKRVTDAACVPPLGAQIDVHFPPSGRYDTIELTGADVLWEDDVLLAINKRPGWHSNYNPWDICGSLRYALGRWLQVRDGVDRQVHLLHQLDRDTSGVLLASKGLLVFGVIFLAEELYETSVVLLALRAGLKAASQRASLA